MTSAVLLGTEWEGARRTPLAQDASSRRYERVVSASGKTALLCIDPSWESRAGFAKISAHLRANGLSAPEVYAADDATGEMLIEDFGLGRFSELIEERPDRENSLYSSAIEAVLAASFAPLAGLRPLTPKDMAEDVMLGFEWYGGAVPGGIQAELAALFEDALSPPTALAQRDVHAENLMWLPDRTGVARVGFLDFQDARLAPPLYDLVSLLTDARRTVSPEVVAQGLKVAAETLGCSEADIRREAAVLSLQRNIRILGIFARLSLRDGRPGYLAFLPRVRAHVSDACQNLGLNTVESALPAATPEFLAELEARCGTIQTR